LEEEEDTQEREEEELSGMQKEDMEESIASVQRGEEAEHRVMESSFKTLRKELLCAWLCAKKKGRKDVRVAGVPHFPPTRLRGCG
jgi:hypothetical protein